MDISIIIPAYNEEDRIAPALDRVSEFFDRHGKEYETIVVDDGSTDSTVQICRQWKRANDSGYRLRVLSIAHTGKGGAVAAGVEAAAGDWVLMTDADLSTPLSEWPGFEKRLEAGAQVVIGSRMAEGARVEKRQPLLRTSLGLLFGKLVNLAFPLGVKDSQCGFKAFQSEAAKELFSALVAKGFCFDVEVVLKARMRGYRLEEVPVTWINDENSRVSMARDWPGVLRELWLIKRELDAGGPEGEGM